MRILLLSFLIISIDHVCAQELEKSDPQALDILESTYEEYKQHSAHKYEFKMEVSYPEREGELFSGTFIEEESKFDLNTTERQIINDGTTVWVYYKGRNEVEINDVEDDEDPGFPRPKDIYELYSSNKFIYAIINQQFNSGQNLTEIVCKPSDRSSDYSKINLVINASLKTIESAHIFFKDGTRIKTELNKHYKGFITTPTTFKFIPENYEGIHVEDLRF